MQWLDKLDNKLVLSDVPIDAMSVAQKAEMQQTKALMVARTLNFSHDAMAKLLVQLTSMREHVVQFALTRDELLENIDIIARSYDVRFGGHSLASLKLKEQDIARLATSINATLQSMAARNCKPTYRMLIDLSLADGNALVEFEPRLVLTEAQRELLPRLKEARDDARLELLESARQLFTPNNEDPMLKALRIQTLEAIGRERLMLRNANEQTLAAWLDIAQQGKYADERTALGVLFGQDSRQVERWRSADAQHTMSARQVIRRARLRAREAYDAYLDQLLRDYLVKQNRREREREMKERDEMRDEREREREMKYKFNFHSHIFLAFSCAMQG